METEIRTMNEQASKDVGSVRIPITSIASDDMACVSNPILVIEETNSAYHRKGDKASCQRNGGLNENRARFILKVHAFQRGARSAFLAKNLHLYPHYEILQTDLTKFRTQCEELSINFAFYPVGANKVLQTTCGSMVHLGSSIMPDLVKNSHLSQLSALIDSIDCHQTQENMCAGKCNGRKLETSNKRNSFQSHFGYAGNHSTRVVENGVARPVLKANLDDIQRQDFSTMTAIGDLMFQIRKQWDNSLDGEFLDDSATGGQRLKMAGEISVSNKIHAMTVNIVGQNLLTGVHCDNHNDGTAVGYISNMNYTLICSKTFITQNNDVISIRKIGYAKQSLTDYIRRDSKFEDIDKEEFGPWWNSQPSVRKNFIPNSTLFDPESYNINSSNYLPSSSEYQPNERNGDIILFPTFNKHVTYSSAYYDAQQLMFEANPGLERSVRKKVELILAMTPCNNAFVYRKTCEHFVKTGLPSGNICELFLNYARENFGSLTSGQWPRHQTSFNHHIEKRWIREAATTVLDIIEQCNHPTHSKPSFTTIDKMAQSISHIGGLGAQHLIHALANQELIDPLYGLEASIASSTLAWKRLRTKLNLGPSQIPAFARYISRKYGFTGKDGENILCKFATDLVREGDCTNPDEVIRHLTQPGAFDVIYASQNIVRFCTKDGDDIPRVQEIRRSDPPNLKPRYCPFDSSMIYAQCRRGANKDPFIEKKLYLLDC
jgi:hypothetical protein